MHSFVCHASPPAYEVVRESIWIQANLVPLGVAKDVVAVVSNAGITGNATFFSREKAGRRGNGVIYYNDRVVYLH